jgi:trk system potassium uptake protein TrkH
LRTGEIAMSLTTLYVTLTFLCFMGYAFANITAFDAFVHSMTTLATNNMTNYNTSFNIYNTNPHYVASLFMFLAALPFVRYVQLATGTARPLLSDEQIRGFVLVLAVFVLTLSGWLALRSGGPFEPAFREVLFNVTSVATGTGYASTDYTEWGALAVSMFFVLGLIGGCTGSTACSVKIFRYQILLAATAAELRHLHSPNRVAPLRYAGRTVSDEVLNSVMAFFMMFYLTLAITAVILVLVGLDPLTAISGAATALANIGPGLGEEIGPDGNFAGLPAAAKWVLAGTMLLGRLELMSVFVLFTAAFWRG